MRTAMRVIGLAALLALAAGCHATTTGGGGRAGAYAGGPVIVVPAEAYGRTLDHLGRRIPRT